MSELKTLKDLEWWTPHCDYCMNQKLVAKSDELRQEAIKIMKQINKDDLLIINDKEIICCNCNNECYRLFKWFFNITDEELQ